MTGLLSLTAQPTLLDPKRPLVRSTPTGVVGTVAIEDVAWDGGLPGTGHRLVGRLTAAFREAVSPPWRNWRFWLVQLLVIAIALLHEATREDGPLPHLAFPHFASMALFLVPVVYAALNFGLGGSAATALWVTVLMAPDLRWHTGIDRWANGIQLGIIDVVAAFVGQRVESERNQRRRADAARRKYTALFESNQAPVLVLDGGGRVREANAAARRLFSLSERGRARPGLVQLVGEDAAWGLLQRSRPDYLAVGSAGTERFFKPLSTPLADEDGTRIVELVLQDVTAERLQQQGTAAYAAHVLSVQESERRRIAGELHDEPLQAALLLIREIRNAEDGREMSLERMRSLADRIAGELRGIARGLRPPDLDHLGVVAAIRKLVEEFEDRSGTEAGLSVLGGPRRPEPNLELCLFRIAQEALHNVERHADAHQVRVRLSFAGGEIRLLVADDGAGFNPRSIHAAAPPTSLGFLGMRERAALVGGRVSIRSAPGRGTVVRAVLPADRSARRTFA